MDLLKLVQAVAVRFGLLKCFHHGGLQHGIIRECYSHSYCSPSIHQSFHPTMNETKKLNKWRKMASLVVRCPLDSVQDMGCSHG